ncbi:MAG: histidine--tRNA ligase [Cyclobacteriaceae bacterium]
MSMQKPGIPKGTRDFGPDEMVKRNYILDTIKETFRLFGYVQLETPAMENLATLTGKYGDEGDQLLFKILNSGSFLKKVSDGDFKEGEGVVLPQIAEKGLRYDLTVPFARYVVMNRNEITFPFRRFQMQSVWRADRPQKGRYREFYQCDADVVGTDSLICEAEIFAMIKRVFGAFGLKDYTIRVNNRKILTGMAEVIGAHGKEGDLCVAIDKLDKIGWEKVKEELFDKGFSKESVMALEPVIQHQSSGNRELISFLKQFLGQNPSGLKGIAELEEVFEYLRQIGETEENIQFDAVLARGLSYYTGAIFEANVGGVSIGSVSGGGRYDNLTGVFGLPDLSGVGFSFGVDRLYDALQQLHLFPESKQEGTKVLLAHFGEGERKEGLKVLGALRRNQISSEIYPDNAKIKKQFNYADKKNIPYVAVIGSEELVNRVLTLKDMKTGQQSTLSIEELLIFFRK